MHRCYRFVHLSLHHRRSCPDQWRYLYISLFQQHTSHPTLRDASWTITYYAYIRISYSDSPSILLLIPDSENFHLVHIIINPTTDENLTLQYIPIPDIYSIMADQKSRALQRKPEAENLKLRNQKSETSKSEDVPMADAGAELATPVRKLKRPNTRDKRYVPSSPRVPCSPLNPQTLEFSWEPPTPEGTWTRRGSSLTPSSYTGRWYDDPDRRAPPNEGPTYLHHGEDVHGMPPFVPGVGHKRPSPIDDRLAGYQANDTRLSSSLHRPGHQRYDYGGRQYRAPEVRQPVSADELYPPAGSLSQVHASTTAKKETDIRWPSHKRSSPGSFSKSMIYSSTESSRDLKRALPRVEENSVASPLAEQPNKRPLERQLTLALRPAGSVESLRGKSPSPTPVMKRQRTAAPLDKVKITDAFAKSSLIDQPAFDYQEWINGGRKTGLPRESGVLSFQERVARSDLKRAREATPDPTSEVIQELLTKETESEQEGGAGEDKSPDL